MTEVMYPWPVMVSDIRYSCIDYYLMKPTAYRTGTDSFSRTGNEQIAVRSSNWTSKLNLHKKLSTFFVKFPELVYCHIFERGVSSYFIVPNFDILKQFKF